MPNPKDASWQVVKEGRGGNASITITERTFLWLFVLFFVFFKIRSMPSAPLTFRVDDKGHIVPERRWRLAFPLLDHIFRSFDF